MKQVKIESDDKNVQITCPHCGNWEQIGVDEQRHRFQSMPIHIWFEATEVSVHRCSECKDNFAVEWDYDNEFKTGNGLNVDEVKEYYLNSGFEKYNKEPFKSEYDGLDWIEYANENDLKR